MDSRTGLPTESQPTPDEGYSSTRGRVGSPPVRPLPLLNKKIVATDDGVPSDTTKLLGDQLVADILNKATDILIGNGIPQPRHTTIGTPAEYLDWADDHRWDRRAELVLRHRPDEQPDLKGSGLTLLMEADWAEGCAESWQRAVKQSCVFLKGLSTEGHLKVSVAVEIIATCFTLPLEVRPVQRSDISVQLWDEIAEKVMNTTLNVAPPTDIRIGISRIRILRSGSPFTVTIRIGIDTVVEEKLWVFLEDRVHQALEPYELGLSVMIYHHDGDELFAFEVVEHDPQTAIFTPMAGLNELPSAVAFDRVRDPSVQYPEKAQALWHDAQKHLGMMSPDGDELVYKLGAASGATAGRYSGYKDCCFTKDDKHLSPSVSREHVVYGLHNDSGNSGDPKAFAKPGDSGSIVWDVNGRALGILFTGKPPGGQYPAGFAYVTPIESILLKGNGNRCGLMNSRALM